MLKYLSKVQHKNYETSEFSEEQLRDIDETVALIKNFPWDDERHLTDIQLTGPSVTICNNQGEYLKVGLYFNNKFCIYYLDTAGTLFECPVTTLDKACELVKAFFEGSLSLTGFDKPLVNFNNKKHFETNSFEYSASFYRFVAVNIHLIIYSLVFLAMPFLIDIEANFPMILIVPMLIFVAVPGTILGCVIVKTLPQKNQYLKISKGQDTFWFGENSNEIKQYNKQNIDHILIHEVKGNRNPVTIVVYKMVFKDGSCINFTNILISSIAMARKFCNYQEKLIEGKKHPLRVL